MNKQKFIEYLRKPAEANESTVAELEQLVKENPYFQSARTLLAKVSSANKSEKTSKHISSAATYATDRILLKKYLKGGLSFTESLVIHESHESDHEIDRNQEISEARKSSIQGKIKSNPQQSPTRPTLSNMEVGTKDESALASIDPSPAQMERTKNLDHLIDELYHDMEELKVNRAKFMEYERKLEEEEAVDKAVKKATSNRTASPSRKKSTTSGTTKSTSPPKSTTTTKKSTPAKSTSAKKTTTAKKTTPKKTTTTKKAASTTKKKSTTAKPKSTTSKTTASAKKSSTSSKSTSSKSTGAKSTRSKPASSPKGRTSTAKKSTAAAKPAAKSSTAKPKATTKKPTTKKSTTGRSTTKKSSTKETKKEDKSDPKRDAQEEIISNFIKQNPSISQADGKQGSGVDLSNESTTFDPEIATEYLAEIYLNQGKTERAKEIYQALMLKFPQKKSYFAGLIKKL